MVDTLAVGSYEVRQAFNACIEARRFAQFGKPTALAVAAMADTLAVGSPGAPRLAATSYLFWTLVKCALEEPWLTTLA
jgi:hypothetical protein